MRIGFVGLGLMGTPMARNLVRAGFEVVVHGRNAATLAQLGAEGARVAGSLRQVAADVDVLCSCRVTPQHSRDVFLGPDGAAAAGRPGLLCIDFATIDPATSRAIAAELASREMQFLDAPVSGGPQGAANATLSIMVGGSDADVARARPLLEVLGDALVHVGDRPGDGDAAKTINNMLSATNLAAAAEALAMGMRAGLDPERLVDCVNGGTGASHAMRAKVGGHVLTGTFGSRFTLGQYLKDLGIARGLADDHRVPTPVNGAAHALWTEQAARGHADEDHTRMVALLLADAGVDRTPQPTETRRS